MTHPAPATSSDWAQGRWRAWPLPRCRTRVDCPPRCDHHADKTRTWTFTRAANTWEYDVVTNAWVDPMAIGAPTKRGSSVCTFDQRIRKLMLYGGVSQPSGTPGGQAWEYDPLLRRWLQLAPSPTPGNLTFAASTFSPGSGGLFFFGGRTSAVGTSQATWTFIGNGTPSVGLMNQTVDEARLVAMGATLTDADPADPNTWTWAQDAGVPVTLMGSTTGTVTAIAPRVTLQTVLRFTVTVNDASLNWPTRGLTFNRSAVTWSTSSAVALTPTPSH